MYLVSGQQCIATENRDYPEWHKDRIHYALWYLEIDNPQLIQYLNQIKAQFKDYLLVPNQRQFHITLFICGFLSPQKYYEDDFSDADLALHTKALQHLNLKSFSIKIGKINSFESALFVEIEDPHQQLKQIRQTLAKQSNEIAALDYCPHITLGLYRDTLASDIILEKISKLSHQSFDLNIKHLTFGYYQAAKLQDQLFSHTQFQLEQS